MRLCRFFAHVPCAPCLSDRLRLLFPAIQGDNNQGSYLPECEVSVYSLGGKMIRNFGSLSPPPQVCRQGEIPFVQYTLPHWQFLKWVPGMKLVIWTTLFILNHYYSWRLILSIEDVARSEVREMCDKSRIASAVNRVYKQLFHLSLKMPSVRISCARGGIIFDGQCVPPMACRVPQTPS